jgi:hypothetical protein
MSSPLERQLADLKQGDHVSPVYDGIEEHLAAAVAFILGGLARGECCLYVCDDLTLDALGRALAVRGVDGAREAECGALLLRTARQFYLLPGEFDPLATIELVRRFEAQALADGFSGLRFAGDMSWSIERHAERDRLIEYEALLNRYLIGSRTTILCLYDRARFDPACILDVLCTHPLVVLGDQVCPNLDYQPPSCCSRGSPGRGESTWRSVRPGGSHSSNGHARPSRKASACWNNSGPSGHGSRPC